MKQAIRLCVVTTHPIQYMVGCAQDLVREGETGHVFSGEAGGLAAAMDAKLGNRANAPAMGARARRLVVDEYSMPVATAGLKAALEAVRP